MSSTEQMTKSSHPPCLRRWGTKVRTAMAASQDCIISCVSAVCLLIMMVAGGMVVIFPAPTPSMDNVLVVGGYGDDYRSRDTVELLNNTSGTKSKILGKFPKKIWGAVGTILNGTPHICGGEDDDHDSLQECWAYNFRSEMWTVSARMREKRYLAAAASHPTHGWVITGGYEPGSLKSIAESTRDGRTFQPFPQLPLGLFQHCLVSLEGSDSGDFFLTGGDSGNGRNKKTLIFKKGRWRQVGDMLTARGRLMCGAVRSGPSGPVEHVVAAGGYAFGTNALSTVEIYSVKSNTWRKGTNLPKPLNRAAVVPYGTTFLIIGGDDGTIFSDKVYEYTTYGMWTEMTMKLSEGKRDLVAINVPCLTNLTVSLCLPVAA